MMYVCSSPTPFLLLLFPASLVLESSCCCCLLGVGLWVSGKLPKTTVTITDDNDDLTWIEWHKGLLSAAHPMFCLTNPEESANRFWDFPYRHSHLDFIAIAIEYNTPVPVSSDRIRNYLKGCKRWRCYSISLFTGLTFMNTSRSQDVIDERVQVGLCT